MKKIVFLIIYVFICQLIVSQIIYPYKDSLEQKQGFASNVSAINPIKDYIGIHTAEQGYYINDKKEGIWTDYKWIDKWIDAKNKCGEIVGHRYYVNDKDILEIQYINKKIFAVFRREYFFKVDTINNTRKEYSKHIEVIGFNKHGKIAFHENVIPDDKIINLLQFVDHVTPDPLINKQGFYRFFEWDIKDSWNSEEGRYEQGCYKDNKKNSFWNSFSKDGKLQFQRYYNDDIPQYEINYKNEKITSIVIYKADFQNNNKNPSLTFTNIITFNKRGKIQKHIHLTPDGGLLVDTF